MTSATTTTTLVDVHPRTPPALTPAERRAVAVVATATAGFGIYGLATGASSTVAYVCTVAVLGVAVLAFRRKALSAPLALGLAALTVAHLAGGLVQMGDGVLYNASPGIEALQYDHLVHSSGVFVGTLVLWTMFASSAPGLTGRRALVALLVLGGLGLGAVNETVEFLATLAHDGSAVGGYHNTGWDLISNVVGASAAAAVISRSASRRPAA